MKIEKRERGGKMGGRTDRKEGKGRGGGGWGGGGGGGRK